MSYRVNNCILTSREPNYQFLKASRLLVASTIIAFEFIWGKPSAHSSEIGLTQQNQAPYRFSEALDLG